MCQYIDTTVLTVGGRVLTRRLWLVAGLAVALVALGGSIQAGLLAPQFRLLPGEEGVDNAWFDTIQNVSWRTWTITGVHLANGASSALVSGRVIRLSLHDGQAPADGRVGPALSRLVVGPGHEFNLKLTNFGVTCKVPLHQLESPSFVSRLPSAVVLSAVIEVATPFGVRGTEYRFFVNRC